MVFDVFSIQFVLETTQPLWVWSRFFGGDFEAAGKEWYRRHYSTLEERLRGSGRRFLRWKVEDGW